MRHVFLLPALLITLAQSGTAQSPTAPEPPAEPPVNGQCECSGGVCPIKRDGRGCSCGCELVADLQPVAALTSLDTQECRDGTAGGFPCRDVDLLSFLPLGAMGGGRGNDVWGWTDPETGREYALAGRSTGTAFVDVTDPARPRYVGDLPTQTTESIWRDIEVFADYAFVVSEAPNHGMQIFDLRQLAGATGAPMMFRATAHYTGFGSSHTLAIDRTAGFAYALGTRTCAGGLHVVNIQDPLQPRTAGCFAADGYTHDAQCLAYDGPDRAFAGREICFNANEDTLTIVDTTDKHAQRQISRTAYDASGYTHQGWLTDDRRFFLVDDELDERSFGTRTRTFVWDVSTLTAPFVARIYEGETSSIDHNLHIVGDLAYQANYRSGLRVLALGDLGAGPPREVGFFDIYPTDDAPEFNGAWSAYPFFASGTVLVNGIEQGLFVLRPRRTPAGAARGVSMTLVPTNRPAFTSSDVAYVARVVNHGPGRAGQVTLRLQPSIDAALTAVASSRGGCTATSIVECAIGSLAAGSEAIVTLRLRAPRAGELVVSGRVTADVASDAPEDNSALAVTTVEAPRRELTLLYPAGGDTVRIGRSTAVQFALRGVDAGVRVELSPDDGRTWRALAADAANVGFFDWVPSEAMLAARVRVTSVADPSLSATSPSFTVR